MNEYDETKYDEMIGRLREKLQRRSRTEAVLNELYRQRTQQKERAAELARALYKEQADVEKLSGGFWSIYYAATGRKEEMLEKERAEALNASMKYDAAQAELERVQAEIDEKEREQREFADCEQEYRREVEEKLEYMRHHSAHAEKIIELEEEIGRLDEQLREIDEAEDAGRKVLRQIDRIAESLSSAEDWGTWDMLGGGMLSSMIKHAHLDDAQEEIKELERLLGGFRAELADVAVQADIHAQTDGFTRFADLFLDGFFVDWMVLSHIQQSQERLDDTRWQTEEVMRRLDGLHRELTAAREQRNAQRWALAVNER